MKKGIFLLLTVAVTLSACTPKSDPLFGTWTVSKVNVQFDEQLSTPELVKRRNRHSQWVAVRGSRGGLSEIMRFPSGMESCLFINRRQIEFIDSKTSSAAA